VSRFYLGWCPFALDFVDVGIMLLLSSSSGRVKSSRSLLTALELKFYAVVKC